MKALTGRKTVRKIYAKKIPLFTAGFFI